MYLEMLNFVSFSLGLVLVTAGFFLSGQKAQVYDIYGSTFPMSLLIVITVGIMIGAIISDTCFYKTSTSCQVFIMILLIVLILSLELSAITAGLASADSVQSRAERSFKRQMKKYAEVNASDAAAHPDWRRDPWIDITQRNFRCCGLRNATDWLAYQPLPPVSCCQEPGRPGCNLDQRRLHAIGCSAVVRAWMTGEVRIFSSLALCITVVQLVGLGTMMYLKYISWRPKLPPELAAEFGLKVEKR